MNGPPGGVGQGHHQQQNQVQSNGGLMDPHHPAAHPGNQGKNFVYLIRPRGSELMFPFLRRKS